MWYGVNFSPALGDPLAGCFFDLPGEMDMAYGLAGLLKHAHMLGAHGPRGVLVAVHLISPALEFMDRGKARLSLDDASADTITGVVLSAAKVLYREGEQRRKSSSRQVRAISRAASSSSGGEMTLKDAVFVVMEEGYRRATGDGTAPASGRTLYYQVRPLVQQYTNKALTDSYFQQTLLVEYRQTRHPLPLIYLEPRGELHEPHGGTVLPLGTRQVDAYKFPSWRYNKILIIEKKGLVPVLLQAKLAERHDMAIVASEGYASEAARTLLEKAEQQERYQIFVLHDADINGYEIARTVREATRRMPNYRVDVVDLGLFYQEAMAMGLQAESFIRKAELPADLECEPEAPVAFTGRRIGPKKWEGTRVELNALSSPQLIAYIEERLERHGAVGKVIPPADVLEQR